MCRVILGHSGVQGSTRPKRVASPYVLQRSKSTSSLTADRMTSPLSLPACPHSNAYPNLLHDLISSPSYDASVSALFASSLQSFTFFWLPSLVRAKVCSDAWMSVVGIYPCLSCMCHILAISQDPECSQSHKQFTRGSSPLPFRRSWLLTYHCYASYLKSSIIHSLFPPTKDCGGTLSYIQGTLALHSITESLCIKPEKLLWIKVGKEQWLRTYKPRGADALIFQIRKQSEVKWIG